MKNYLVLILGFSILNSFAQEVGYPELVGDRPDQTESAFVIPKGYFQFEDGFIYENKTTELTNISYSSVLLRYGLFENFELRFATGYNKMQQTSLDDVRGFTPVSLGAKIHVNKENDWIPQIAFLGHINIAKTGTQDYMQDYHSAQMVLTFNHTMNESWSVGYSLGVEFLNDIDYSIGTYTIVSGFTISDKLGAFIEAYGDFSKYLYADNKINGGVTYLLTPALQLDFAGGFGLSQYSAENYFGIGFIYLFKL